MRADARGARIDDRRIADVNRLRQQGRVNGAGVAGRGLVERRADEAVCSRRRLVRRVSDGLWCGGAKLLLLSTASGLTADALIAGDALAGEALATDRGRAIESAMNRTLRSSNSHRAEALRRRL